MGTDHRSGLFTLCVSIPVASRSLHQDKSIANFMSSQRGADDDILHVLGQGPRESQASKADDRVWVQATQSPEKSSILTSKHGTKTRAQRTSCPQWRDGGDILHDLGLGPRESLPNTSLHAENESTKRWRTVNCGTQIHMNTNITYTTM